MNGTRILGTVLAVVIMIFVIAPTASAQTYAGILDGQWFKLNLSMKGYQIKADGETVSGKGAGSTHAYLYMSYGGSGYTITTCMQDDVTDGIWYKNTGAPIPIANIYGSTYPQVWDFQGNPLQFFNGADTFSAYLTFDTKITPDKADPAKLKSATIGNVACALYADLAGGEYGCGSCTIKGSLIPAAKVPTTVPAACQ
jgi:hypothetical protein